MNSKRDSIVISSIIAFALIAGIPPIFEYIYAEGDDGNTVDTSYISISKKELQYTN
jgi:hypothetical protein